MNTARTLIDQYKMTVQEEEQVRQQLEADVITQAQERFGLNCRTWLGELWDEFLIVGIESQRFTAWNSNPVKFILTVGFLGARGAIEQSFDLQRKCWESAKLDFGNLQFPGGAWCNTELHLYMDGNYNAIVPGSRDLGHLLAKLEEYQPIRDENHRLQSERRKRDLLDFSNNTRQEITIQLIKGLKEFPDLTDQLQENAGAAMRAVGEVERKNQEENRHYEQVTQERESLQKMAHLAWRKPFTLYLVSYGVALENGEEGDYYTRNFYSFDDKSEGDGYWRALENGKPTRRIRPIHVLSIEQVTVTSLADAPYEAKRYIDLASKRVEGASTTVYLPPAEVFAFDIEAMSEEMAAA